MFAVGTNDAVWHRWQTAGGGWSSWTSLGGDVRSVPDIGVNADGRLEVFVTGISNKTMYHKWQQGGGWSGWASLGGLEFDTWRATPPRVERNADGRLEVFMNKWVAGDVYHKWQLSPGGAWSCCWPPVGDQSDAFNGRPAVGMNADGRMHVFAVNYIGKMKVAWQLSGGGWTGWNPF